ncbi:hypothetical protein FO519_009264, partial [Halicephalobus sp. NKZ332]
KEPFSKSFSDLKSDQGIKVTSFGIEEDEVVSIQTQVPQVPKVPQVPQVPPPSARPVPSFPPPKSPLALPENFDDYDDVDYEAMEEEQKKRETTVANSTPKVPPAVPPKPSYLKQKRNSDFLEALQILDEVISKPISRKGSAHSLFCQTEKENEVDEDNNFILSFLDRTQSCSNLVIRNKSRLSKEQDEENGLKKYPSVKIDPSPLLPTRSNTNLSSISALTMILNEKREDEFRIDGFQRNEEFKKENGFKNEELQKNNLFKKNNEFDTDYDDLKNTVSQIEADYDNEIEEEVLKIFKGLLNIYDDFLNGKMPQEIPGCFLPFIQPLVQLFSKSDYVHSMKKKNFDSFEPGNLDILSNLILLARHVLFENDEKVENGLQGIQTTSIGNNPLSTESLIHCLLETSVVAEPKESEKRKIRQLFEVAF